MAGRDLHDYTCKFITMAEEEAIDVDKELARNPSDSEVSFDEDLLNESFDTVDSPCLHEEPNMSNEDVIEGLQPEDWIDGDSQTENFLRVQKPSDELVKNVETDPTEEPNVSVTSISDRATLNSLPTQSAENYQQTLPNLEVKETEIHENARIVIGSSNLSGVDHYLGNVIYRRAIRLNEGRFRFMDEMDNLLKILGVSVVVISALQNSIRDHGFQNWKNTTERYVSKILEVAEEMPLTKFFVLAPYTRTSQFEHQQLLKPITELLEEKITHANLRNVSFNKNFSAKPSDLQKDGVHLKNQSRRRLFDVVRECITKPWNVKSKVSDILEAKSDVQFSENSTTENTGFKDPCRSMPKEREVVFEDTKLEASDLTGDASPLCSEERRVILEDRPGPSQPVIQRFSGRLEMSPRTELPSYSEPKPVYYFDESSTDEFGDEDSLINEEDFYYYPTPKTGRKRKSAPKPDKGSRPFVLRDRQAQTLCRLKVRENFLEMFHDARNILTERKTYQMPTLTLKDCEEMTKAESILASPVYDPRFIRVFCEESTEEQDMFISKMLQNIRTYRYIIIDSEGNLKLRKFHGEGFRLFISIGDFHGNVLLFPEADDIPSEFRDILQDWRYVKIQSAIEIDMNLLLKIDNPIHVTGWADTQVLFKAFLSPEAERTKPEAILSFLGREYKNWPLVFRYGYYHIPKDAQMHSAQDSRLPTLVLLKAVELRAKRLGYGSEDDVFPLARLALDLSRHVSMANARGHLSLDVDKNWRPPLRKEKGTPNEFGLNDAVELTRIRMAQEDFLEVTFPPGQEPEDFELTQTAIRLWANKKLPSHNLTMAKNETIQEELNQRCTKCGEENHRFKTCPQTTPFVSCAYDHGGETLPDHSIVVCPSLHHSCKNCHMRGHKEHCHQFWDPLQMKNLFQRHQHLGAFTCIPFLAKLPEHESRVLYYHWSLGLCLESLEHCLGNAFRLSIFEPKLRFGQPTPEEERLRVRKAVERRNLQREISEFNLRTDEDFGCSLAVSRQEFEKARSLWRERSLSKQVAQETSLKRTVAEKPPQKKSRQRIVFP